ncbi:aminopeptidase N-like [Polyergus mexicanus]|uniref:aminopeptidase N-like n=1 Tax=Polyergus mexicanus TaxID=615972 RepID=UPI0038B5803D
MAIFLKPLFYGGLIFITAIAASVDENSKKSSIALNNHFDDVMPMHYDVKLISYFKEDREERDEIYVLYKTEIEQHQAKGSLIFYGELNVAVDIFHPTTKISLNSSRSILYLYGELRQKDTMFGTYLVDNFEYDAVTQLCVLYFDDKLPRGSYILNIIFLNAINNTENIIISLNTIREKFGQYGWSNGTHFQAIGARQLFPCWDVPTIKTTFNISIKHHREYKAFSNMPIRNEKILKHKDYKTETYMKWTYFDITPAMSTYIVTLVITPITALYNFHIDRIIIWRRPELQHMKYAQMVANKVILEVKWENLKIPTVQFVAICGLLYDNQNWGLVLNSVFKSTTPDDFWVVMQTTVDESHNDPYIKKHMPSLKTMIYNWTSMDCPVLRVTRDYSKNSTNITIENYDIFEKNLVWIPVTYTTQTIPNFTKLKYPFYDERLIVMRSNKPSEQVIINEDGWVIFNLRQAGYYRVNYDPDNWQKIAKYLNSKEFTKIHVLNRAKIIDDAFYFMVEQQLDPSIFWELTSYLSRETNYIAWYPMIKVLEYMSSVFPLPNKEVQNIKAKVLKILGDLLWEIKYEEDSEENDLTKCLRQEAIKWACILDDSQCQKKAHDKLLMRIVKLETNK